jgi:hypothetical protein
LGKGFTDQNYSDSCIRSLFFGRQTTFLHCLESGAVLEERNGKPADGAVALFGNNDLGFALQAPGYSVGWVCSSSFSVNHFNSVP